MHGLLDCPHYTRPELLDGQPVPEVLLSGDHAAIARWRLQQSLGRTWLRRPDLLAQRVLSADEQVLLDGFKDGFKQAHDQATAGACMAARRSADAEAGYDAGSEQEP